MSTPRPAILDHVAALADGVRARLLLVLERHELTVSELCGILALPQSTISRHLKVLADDGWLRVRREGTRRFYYMDLARLAAVERRLWLVVRSQLDTGPEAREDRQRLRFTLEDRRSRSAEFFATTAADWDRLRQEMFGQRFDLLGLLGLLDPQWVVGDLGCGTGQLSAALAPFVGRVIAVDSSEAMLEGARTRLASSDNVELRLGDLETLPLLEGELDAAILMLVLHHVAEPGKVLASVSQALRPGGRLLVVDMTAHDREDYRQQMGHVWLGFTAEQIRGQLENAEFDAIRVHTMAPETRARGPALFVATARQATPVLTAAPDPRPLIDAADVPRTP